MILNSFLAGFISYVVVIIYNLLKGNSLEVVFLSGIKYLFYIPILVLLIQLSIYFIKTQFNNNSDQKVEEDNKRSEESTETTDDFSPLNPPEIEYEDQNEK